MSLEAGTSLGHYEILSPLGVGGMGEVYRAKDTKLGREVAIKLLLEEVSGDPERLARFEREARVLASLNHNNIATLHGFEREGDANFLVMELVEGDTLADRIARGPIPVDEAIPLFLQIAEGLEAAHDQGVVHRDLKPANIKLGSDGGAAAPGPVKILDFGLAKALAEHTDTADPAVSQSPTLTLAATQRGEILGTAAYMSPEQAQGQPADQRADVWAFGICLLEALTGRSAFEGENVSLILASVLKDSPDLEALPPNCPPALRRLLRRCLVKKPRNRLPHIGAARLELEEALSEPDEMSRASEADSEPARRRNVVAFAAAAAIAGALLAGLAVWTILGNEEPPQAPTTRFTLKLPESDRLRRGAGPLLALSPDGRTLVYGIRRNGVAQLFRRPLGQFEATPIAGTEGAAAPFFSPDGEWLGFVLRDGELRKVPMRGGPPQTLTTLDGGFGLDWGADGQIIATTRNGLLQIPAAGGEPTTLFDFELGSFPSHPQILAEDEAILFSLESEGGIDLHLLLRATEEDRILLRNATAGRVLGSGHLVFVRSGALWAVPFDRNALEIAGTPAPVVEGIRVERFGATQYAVAADGSLAYIPGATGPSNRQLLWVDRKGVASPTPAPLRDYRSFSVSPDERLAAVSIVDDTGNADIWVADLDRGTLARLTSTEADEGFPIWTPDGRRVTYWSDRNGQPEIFWQQADGGDAAESLLNLESAITLSPNGWSSDGKILVVTARFPETGRDIGTVSMDEPGIWTPLIQTAAGEWDSSLSPDGNWIAHQSDETGRSEIYIQRFPVPDGRIAVSVGGAVDPKWSADGREILYARSLNGPPDAVMRVSIDVQEGDNPIAGDPPSLVLGSPELLFEWTYYARPGALRFWNLSTDGQRFLMATPEGTSYEGTTGREINIVLDWFTELNERVPIP